MKHLFKITVLVGVVLLLGASCSGADTTNKNVLVPLNENTNVNAATEDIIYGTNMDPAFVEESRQDCANKGGTFDECGSACKPGKMCIASCALRCDF